MILDPRHLHIVQSILLKYPYTFYAFGSRIKGQPRRLSDLDLCYIEDIPWNTLAHIEDDFEGSDLPFTVDIIAWHRCDPAFQESIRKDLVCIQLGKSAQEIEKKT